MAIIRAKRERNYSVISNDIWQDNQLSWQAMGMLSYILSKPDNWSVCAEHLIKVTKDTAKKTAKEGVYNILKELKNAGFISMKKHSDGSVLYTVYDHPTPAEPNQANPKQGPNTAKPDQAKPKQYDPDTANPEQAKPNQAEPPLISTDLLTSTDLKQSKKSKPKKAVSKKLDFSGWPAEPSEQILKDWKTVRDKKQAPITQTVINRFAPKLERARDELGMSVDDVLGVCIERGWRGFEVDWLVNHLRINNFTKLNDQGVNQIGTNFEPPEGWEPFKESQQ
ncbi:hypothetical protein DI392_00840 [Vibrio albus]|uniref:Helix-turn-helix domain-containing protein n=1 Tax=Vibrio albus TaxID=2200953 RepID=A0A2U3BDL1_9VIBR|nr:hypothetical protein [Vibrio albus]PWI34860.1 hypothetical protein DI392_00840 [Vibrio albus]